MRTQTMISIVLLVLLAVSPVMARTWIVSPDGSGDAPTIQAAIDSVSNGDIIGLLDGTYTGDGNRGLEIGTNSFTIRSQSGDPSACIIDVEGPGTAYCLGFWLFSPLDGPIVNIFIRGLTITRSWGVFGGGIGVEGNVRLTVTNCVFLNNAALIRGGGMWIGTTRPVTVADCTFIGNSAANGGAIMALEALFELTGCTFMGNSADSGGALLLWYMITCTVSNCTFSRNTAPEGAAVTFWEPWQVPALTNSVIAFNLQGAGVYWDGVETVSLSQNDIFGNEGGDWVGNIAPFLGTGNNFELDPLFCDLDGQDVSLNGDSPCLAENSPGGELVGAWGWGCPGISATPEELPAGVHAVSCQPNPFNPQTSVTFSLAHDEWAEAGVFDLTGRRVEVLVAGTLPRGQHTVVWDGRDAAGRDMPSGSYIVRLETAGHVSTSKISLIR